MLNRSDVELDCRHIVTTRAPLGAGAQAARELLSHRRAARPLRPGRGRHARRLQLRRHRPIDQHVKGFAAMGADRRREGGYVCAAAEGGAPDGGANIYLDVVSVGATMNIMIGRGSGGRHDRHRKRREGAAHRRSRQLPQLHGRGRHAAPAPTPSSVAGVAAAARRHLRHHPRPDRGGHLHGGRCRHGRTRCCVQQHHPQAHGLHHRQAAGDGRGDRRSRTTIRSSAAAASLRRANVKTHALPRLPDGHAAADHHRARAGAAAPASSPRASGTAATATSASSTRMGASDPASTAAGRHRRGRGKAHRRQHSSLRPARGSRHGHRRALLRTA